jgi:hypothetical protein
MPASHPGSTTQWRALRDCSRSPCSASSWLGRLLRAWRRVSTGVGLAPEVRVATDRQLVKMTGAELDSIVALQPSQREAVREAIDVAFVSTFRG